jgi:large subunit ribosomal protein L2
MGGGHKSFIELLILNGIKTTFRLKLQVLNMIRTDSKHCPFNYAMAKKDILLLQMVYLLEILYVSGPDADIKVGNALPLSNIPEGPVVHNIGLRPAAGGRLVQKCRFVSSANG